MSQDDKGEKQERRDFFISYTGQDKPWAEWIAAQLDAVGYTFFFQAWDFRPGSNFVVEMDQAAKQADRTLLVLSAAYQQSDFAHSEWTAAYHQDPTGSERRLLPVRIEPCELTGLLAQVVYIDLVGYDAEQARERLLKGIQTGRVRPEQIVFPGPRVASAAFPGAFPARWNIPFARNPFFTGREELLERLHTELGSTQAAVALSQPQAISGLGGIGKTQLAIEYAYRYRSDYQAVLWVRAETTEALNASYSELSALLGLPEKDAQEQEVVVQAVKQWLRQTNGWLLILDNADDLNQVQAFVPTGVPGQLILTTRAQITGKVAKRLEVDTLEADVGALFLLRRAGLLAADASLDAASHVDQAAARALTRELGGLPLALDQAGAYIEETECSLADYQQQYQTRRAELLARRGALVDDHPESVATTWSLSFEQVEQHNPAAAELLRLCAFLAPDTIPEELLTQGAGKLGEVLAPVAADPYQLDQTITALRAYSLVRRNPKEKTFSVHRLVQAVLQDGLEEAERRSWAERAMIAVNAAFVLTDESWLSCERLLPQALAAIQFIGRYQMTIWEAGQLLYNTASYLQARTRYAEAESLYQRAVRIPVDLDHLSEHEPTNSRMALADLYIVLGRYTEAEKLYQEAWRSREVTLGPESILMIDPLSGLAAVCQAKGKYEEAESLYREALRISERMGPKFPALRSLLEALARVCTEQSKYEEAESLYQRAVSIGEQYLGLEHPDVANSLHDLAIVYSKQGKYALAEPLYQRSLRIFEQHFGPEHPRVASPLNNLANLYSIQGKHGEAEQFYRRALHIYEQSLGPEHPMMAQTLYGLAMLYESQSKYEEAEILFQRALHIYEQQLGPQHPEVARSLSRLANSYCHQGKYTEAEPLYRQALHICEQSLGPEHLETANIMDSLAQLWKAQGNDEEARAWYARALAVREHPHTTQTRDALLALQKAAQRWYEEGCELAKQKCYEVALVAFERAIQFDPQLVLAHTDRGMVLWSLHRYEEALISLEQAIQLDPHLALAHNNKGLALCGLDRYEEALSAFEQTICLAPDFALAHNNKGMALSNLNRYEEALSALEQALHLDPHLAIAHINKGMALCSLNRYEEALTVIQSLEQDHVTGKEVGYLLYRTASYLQDRARYAEAEPLYQRALYISEQSLGPEHPEVAFALHDLAQFYQHQGKYTEAESLYQRALHIQEQQLGPEHLDVADSLYLLASLYLRQGKHAEVESLYQRALHIQEQHLGPEHPDLITWLSNLGLIYTDRRRYAEADSLLQRALRIGEQQSESEHSKVATPLHRLAMLYQRQSKYVEAEAYYRRSLHIQEQQLGLEHPKVARSLYDLANLYFAQGKYTQAEPLYRRALRIREQSLGPGHPETANIMESLARLWEAQGNYEEAGAWYARVLAIREQALGADHPHTTKTRNALLALQKTAQYWNEEGCELLNQKWFEEALAAFEQAIRLDPHLALAHNNKGMALCGLNRYEEALTAFEQAIRLDPHFTVAHNNKRELDNYRLRCEVLTILGMADATKEKQDAFLNKIESIAQKRLGRAIPAMLTKKQLRQVDAMRAAGKNTDDIMQWIVEQLPQYDEMIRAIILHVAKEATGINDFDASVDWIIARFGTSRKGNG